MTTKRKESKPRELSEDTTRCRAACTTRLLMSASSASSGATRAMTSSVSKRAWMSVVGTAQPRTSSVAMTTVALSTAASELR